MQYCGEIESSAENKTLIKRQLDGTRQSAVERKSAKNEYREHRIGVNCTRAVVGRSASTELDIVSSPIDMPKTNHERRNQANGARDAKPNENQETRAHAV